MGRNVYGANRITHYVPATNVGTLSEADVGLRPSVRLPVASE